jgi:hypothetical protein
MMGVCIDRKAQSDQLKLIMVTELMSRGEHRPHLLASHLSSSAHWLFSLGQRSQAAYSIFYTRTPSERLSSSSA